MGPPTDTPRSPPPTALEVRPAEAATSIAPAPTAPAPTALAPTAPAPTRGRVLRDFALFQLKLLVDGLKDLVLSPLSLGVLVVGLISPQWAGPLWRRIFRVGRALDHWIDLFPDPEADASGRSGPTMHSAIGHAEALVAALRRGGVADPHVQAQLAAVLRTVNAAVPGAVTPTPARGTQASG